MKAFIKPFEAPQRSVKMKIFVSIQLLETPGTGSINREELRLNSRMENIVFYIDREKLQYQYLFHNNIFYSF